MRPGAALIAVMAATATVALIVFVWGFLSLLLDRDVIEGADVAPLVGPAMVVAVTAVVVVHVRRRRPTRLPARAASTLLATLIATPLAGAVVLAITRAEVGAIPVFFGREILDPFVLTASVIAAAVVVAAEFAAPRAAASVI